MSKLSKYQPRAVKLGPNGERLTTSAMIASLAGPDQRTAPATFGHALAELARTRPEIVGLTAASVPPTRPAIRAWDSPPR